MAAVEDDWELVYVEGDIRKQILYDKRQADILVIQ
jgi:hypothetical protein